MPSKLSQARKPKASSRAAAPKPVTPKDVRAALATWLDAVSDGNSARVVRLYARDAVLLPTVAAGVYDTPELRKQYFDHFTAQKNLKGVLVGKPAIKIHGGMALAAGLYNFSFEANGVTQQVPARYSFVYRAAGKGLLITHHHSSKVPVAG